MYGLRILMSNVYKSSFHLFIIGCGVQRLLLISIHICTLPLATVLILVCTWSIVLSEINFTYISTCTVCTPVCSLDSITDFLPV